jgi:hypothetical protein
MSVTWKSIVGVAATIAGPLAAAQGALAPAGSPGVNAAVGTGLAIGGLVLLGFERLAESQEMPPTKARGVTGTLGRIEAGVKAVVQPAAQAEPGSVPQAPPSP